MATTKKPITAAICGILLLVPTLAIASTLVYLFLVKIGIATIPPYITDYVRNNYGDALTVVGYTIMVIGFFYGMFAIARNIRKTNKIN